MAKRYELSDEAWAMVADLFVEKRNRGQPRLSDGLMLDNVLWVLRSGAAWRDMPERFGSWSTVYQRFWTWRNQGMFDQMLRRLHLKLNDQGLLSLAGLDDRFDRCIRYPNLLRRREQRGPEEPADHALGRSRGGLTTKIHRLCDAQGVPLRFLLSSG